MPGKARHSAARRGGTDILNAVLSRLRPRRLLADSPAEDGVTLAPLDWPPFRPGAGHNAEGATERDPSFDHGTDGAPVPSRRGGSSAGSTAGTAEDDPERADAMQAMLRNVRVTVDRLPAKQRSALLLVCRHGLSYRDAADALGLPVDAFAEQLRQAREAVQAGLQPDMCWSDDASSGRCENGALDEN